MSIRGDTCKNIVWSDSNSLKTPFIFPVRAAEHVSIIREQYKRDHVIIARKSIVCIFLSMRLTEYYHQLCAYFKCCGSVNTE